MPSNNLDRKSNKQHRLYYSSLAGIFAAISFPAYAGDDVQPEAHAAQNVPNYGDEIVVTARNRAETLLDAPVAVSAISEAQLSRVGGTDLAKIADIVPQLIVSRSSSGNGGYIGLRGIGTAASDPGAEASVSINIDGIQISRGWVTQSAFFDLQQVEVLKGPQALFFGKNSPAGVISITSAGATKGFQLNGRVGYEFLAKQRYIEGAISGPLTDSLGFRLAGRYDKMDGWIINDAKAMANPWQPEYPTPGATTNKLTPNTDTLLFRGTLEWNPATDFSAVLKLLYNRMTDDDLTGQLQAINCADGFDHPSTLGQIDIYQDCRPDRHRATSAIPVEFAENYPLMRSEDPFTFNRNVVGSLKLDYDAGPVKLTSITGIYDLYVNGSGAFDYTSFARIPSVVGEDSRMFTQEFRFLSQLDGPLNFAAGLFFEDNKRENWNVARLAVGTVPEKQVVPDPVTGNQTLYWAENFLDSNTYSAFAQLIYDITPDIELSGGARFTRETKTARIGNRFVNSGIAEGGTSADAPGAPYRPAGDYLIATFKDNNVSPEVTLSWHPTSQSTLYGGYRTGYKSGGFSMTGVLTRASTMNDLIYGSEKARGFEVGYKGRLADGRLMLNTNIYRYRYEDLQRTIFDPERTSFYVRNAAAAIVKGIEVDATMRATEALTLNANIAYNHADYANFAGAPCYTGQTLAQGCEPIPDTNPARSAYDRTGTRLSRAPRVIMGGGFQFEQPIASHWNIGIAADGRYSSAYFTQEDGDHRGYQDAFLKLNATLRLFQPDGRLSLDLIGRNLTNQYVVQASTAKPLGRAGDLSGTIDRPREVIIQASFRY